MTTAQRIENVVIYRAERINCSVNGNPRYRLHTDHGVFLTQSDASLGYGIDNYTRPLRDDFAIGNDAPIVTLLTTRAYRVFGIEKDGKVLH